MIEAFPDWDMGRFFRLWMQAKIADKAVQSVFLLPTCLCRQDKTIAPGSYCHLWLKIFVKDHRKQEIVSENYKGRQVNYGI